MQRYFLPYIMLSAVIHCGGSSSNSNGPIEPGPQKEVPSQIPAENFFSSETPGRWKDRKDEHEILVRDVRVYKQGKEKMRELGINVPLQGEPRHYLEVGLVLDNSLKKELAKVSFKPATPVYDFKLSIPADNPYAVFVVIKCNQHDMWMKRIEPLKKKEEE